MNRKLKSIFNSLEASPEIKEKKCDKKVRQLRSTYSSLEVGTGLDSDTLKNRITRLCISLQEQVSDPTIKTWIRKIQSESDKLYNDMNDDPGELDFSLSWSVDDD